jgi:hypothetical protein
VVRLTQILGFVDAKPGPIAGQRRWRLSLGRIRWTKGNPFDALTDAAYNQEQVPDDGPNGHQLQSAGSSPTTSYRV